MIVTALGISGCNTRESARKAAGECEAQARSRFPQHGENDDDYKIRGPAAQLAQACMAGKGYQWVPLTAGELCVGTNGASIFDGDCYRKE
jgi:hypothetical protein